MNIFEKATRQKLRFASTRGELTIEQLWDIPLLAKNGNGFDLDTIAKSVNRELKEVAEESFVATANPARTTLELKLEILKHIISVKLDERSKAEKAESNRAERERLMEILQKKKDAQLEDLSVEEIQARLDALKG